MGRTKIPAWMFKLAIRYLPAIIAKISPQIRLEVVDFVKQLEIKANQTENEVDDFLVDLLKIALDIE